MYKLFFKRFWLILVSPSKAWNLIAEDKKETFNHRKYYFFPMIMLASVMVFLKPLIETDEILPVDLLNGLRNLVLLFVSYLIAYLSAPPIMDLFHASISLEKNRMKAEKLWLYALTPVFLVRMLEAVFPNFFFLNIFMVYVVYIIWEAGGSLYAVPDNQRAKYTMVDTAIILLLPFLFEILLKWIIPGLAK